MQTVKTFFSSLIVIALAGIVFYNLGLALFETPQFQHTEERAVYDELLRASRMQAASSRAVLQDRMRRFDPTMNELETRNEIVITLAEYAGENDLGESITRPVVQDNAQILSYPTIEEGESRHSRDVVVTNISFGLQDRDERLLVEQERRLEAIANLATARTEIIRGILDNTQISFIAQDNLITDDVILTEEFFVYLNETGVQPEFIQRVRRVMARIVELKNYQELLSSTPMARPLQVNHRLNSGFGVRIDPITFIPRHHNGLDFIAFMHAPVVATAPGRVVFAGYRGGYGNCVYIDHGNSFQTRYAHMSEITVTQGQEVVLGDEVGKVGSTGRSTGAHLHYEVWYHGRAINPLYFLEAGRYIY